MIPENFCRFKNVREFGRNGENVTYEAEDCGKPVLLVGWKAAEPSQKLSDQMESASEGEIFYHEDAYFLVTERESAAARIEKLREREWFSEISEIPVDQSTLTQTSLFDEADRPFLLFLGLFAAAVVIIIVVVAGLAR